MNDINKTAGTLISAINAVKETEAGREAGNELGKTAVTLTKTVNNVLLPLAAVNFAFDKAREYFDGKFHQELNEKTSSIPPEELQEPRAFIAGPALQGMSFSVDDDQLRNLYLNLISSDMDKRIRADVHPAFVEIIRQFTSDDAAYFQGLFQDSKNIPIVQIRRGVKNNGAYTVVVKHLIGVERNGSPVDPTQYITILENLERLGLIHISYSSHFIEPENYSWVERNTKYIELQRKYNIDNDEIYFEKGQLLLTEFGKRFYSAVKPKP